MYKHSMHDSGWVAALAGLGAFFMMSGAAFGRECWLDIYDKADFAGSRVHIEGPANLPSLKDLNKEDWSNRIESLKVGSGAEVVAFRKPNFEEAPQGQINHPQAFKNWGEQEIPAYQDQEISFGPGKQEHHLGELKFHRNINSIVVRCRK
ncbi:hypothetical protein [Methylomagnum sp.]